jgi:hypothetical protein
VLVVVGDRVQWRVAVVLLLHLLRGRAVHVVLVRASVVIPAAETSRTTCERVEWTSAEIWPADLDAVNGMKQTAKSKEVG